MRINRLDLIRYGRFTDSTLDFGPKPDGGADLHIVYGPNEAGKTTIFNSVLDLLFGIEPRSRYNFRHSYDQMRIGASLQIDGRERTYQRVKLKQNNLLDASGVPVGDTALVGALGGISREACRVMFSLDDETLEQGGDSILASKGELGQLLFSASAGLADLSDELEKIEKELSEFHRSGARDTGLAKAKRRIGELADQRKAIDMQASAYGRLVEERDRAAAAYAEANQRLVAAMSRQADVKAGLKAMPLLQERKAISTDDLAIAVEARILSVAMAESIYRKERDDLPNREAESAAADAEVIGLIAALGHAGESQPGRLLLPAAAVATLKELAGAHGALQARHDAARRAVDEATRALADASVEGDSNAADPEALRRLTAALEAVRTERSGGRLRDAEQRVNRASLAREKTFVALAPWSGDADLLGSLVAPADSDIAGVAARVLGAGKTLEARRSDADKAAADLARKRSELKALGELGSLSVGADHAAIRAERERLWARHRHELDAASAEAFEQAMRQDDAAVLAQLTQAAAVARLAEVRAAEAVAAAEQAIAAEALKAAETEAAAADRARAALVSDVSPALPRTMSADALQAWLARRNEALAAADDLRSATFDQAEARSELMELRGELIAALTAAGATITEPIRLSAIEETAAGVLRQAAALEERSRVIRNLERTLAARQQELDEASASTTAWQTAWRSALSESWLGAMAPPPSPAAAMTLLDVLADLRNALEKRAERHDRLGKIRLNMQAFRAEADAAADALGMGRAGADPLVLFEAMKERVARARADAERLKEIERRLAEIAAEHPALELDGVDGAMLEQELQRLDEEIATLRDNERKAFHARETAASQLAAVGGDARAALIEAERETALTILRADSERWLRLTLGARAVREALRLYRDAHRSSMLEAASDAFRIISREAYRGLSAHAIDGVEHLVAIAADGSSKPVTELALSKGTRFQLYLALRVAGHREFARERTPPPFILDDIMETFDDFRAEEAFRLLGGMAEFGQVIYLTHHRHLLPIASEACAGVRIHEISV